MKLPRLEDVTFEKYPGYDCGAYFRLGGRIRAMGFGPTKDEAYHDLCSFFESHLAYMEELNETNATPRALECKADVLAYVEKAKAQI